MPQDVATQPADLQIGAANPKAIAELRLGRRLDPKAPDFQATMAKALDLPYEQLFDPKFNSPVFAGLQKVQVPVEPATPQPANPAPVNVRLAAPQVTAPPQLAIGSPPTATGNLLIKPLQIIRPDWWRFILTDLKYAVPGQFIVNVPTATAPVQGALGDCWLISAMASVAWCYPDAIVEKTLKDGSGVLASGGADYEFDFYAKPNWSSNKVTKRVKDGVPQSSGMYIYACSSVPGETWPANMEKAFIGMRGATGIGEPSSSNYDELNGGDAAWAVASLVGRTPWYHATNMSDAFNLINARCSGGCATQPMTAWTYGSSFGDVYYDSRSGIVANHAYSILGTEISGGQNYIVLRNPWGFYEGTLNTLGGAWQGMSLPSNGVFALRVDTFVKYYAGFGGA
jgi:hypothetical protein